MWGDESEHEEVCYMWEQNTREGRWYKHEEQHVEKPESGTKGAYGARA